MSFGGRQPSWNHLRSQERAQHHDEPASFVERYGGARDWPADEDRGVSASDRNGMGRELHEPRQDPEARRERARMAERARTRPPIREPDRGLQGNYGETGAHFGFDDPPRAGTRMFRAPKGYQRSDARISEEANEALSNRPELDPRDIEVEVSEGEVTLRGTVSRRSEKFRAEELVADVLGVREVHNCLRVSARPGSRDAP